MALDGRCETCTHWTGFYERLKPGERAWGHCELTASSFDKPEHTESLANVGSGDDLWNVLNTREDFGCVQWQAKEAD